MCSQSFTGSDEGPRTERISLGTRLEGTRHEWASFDKLRGGAAQAQHSVAIK